MSRVILFKRSEHREAHTRKIVMEWLVLFFSAPRASRNARSFALAIVSRGEILGSCAIEQDNGDNLRRGFAQKIAHPRAVPTKINSTRGASMLSDGKISFGNKSKFCRLLRKEYIQNAEIFNGRIEIILKQSLAIFIIFTAHRID